MSFKLHNYDCLGKRNLLKDIRLFYTGTSINFLPTREAHKITTLALHLFHLWRSIYEVPSMTFHLWSSFYEAPSMKFHLFQKKNMLKKQVNPQRK